MDCIEKKCEVKSKQDGGKSSWSETERGSNSGIPGVGECKTNERVSGRRARWKGQSVIALGPLSPHPRPLFIAHTRPVHNINMLHLWPRRILLFKWNDFTREIVLQMKCLRFAQIVTNFNDHSFMPMKLCLIFVNHFLLSFYHQSLIAKTKSINLDVKINCDNLLSFMTIDDIVEFPQWEI